MNKKTLVIIVVAFIIIVVAGFVGIKLTKKEFHNASNKKVYLDSTKGTDIVEILKGNWISEDTYYDDGVQQCVGDGFAIFTADDKVIWGGKFHAMAQRTVEFFNISSDNVYKLNLEPIDGYVDTYTFDVSNIDNGILKVGNTTYKLVNKDSVTKDTVANILCNDTNIEHKTALTSQEINEINDFLDVGKNNPGAIMQLASFATPKLLFSNTNNKTFIKAICDRKEIAYKFDDRGMGVAYVKMETVKQQLKNLTNYDYSEDTLKTYFSEFYNADNNEFQFLLDSTLNADIGTMKKGYKKDDKYEITLSNDIKIVLQKIDGKYYYYSSVGVAGDDFSLNGNGEGKAIVTGYAYIEERTDSDSGEKYQYILFKITESSSDNFMKYIESMNGNSFVSKNAIGLGCLKDGIISYNNASDDNGGKGYNYTLSDADSSKIINSSSSNLIRLDLLKNKLTNGGSASSCYSHITRISIIND